MTRPSTPATWDSNNTNTALIAAGHVTDGFIASEVVSSTELNTVLRNIGLWIAYVDPGATYTLPVQFMPPQNATDLNDLTIATPWAVQVMVPVGRTIKAFRARIKDSATGPTQIRIDLKKSADGVAATNIGGGFSSSGAGTVQTIGISGLSETVAALTTYYITFAYTAGAAPYHIYAVEVDLALA